MVSPIYSHSRLGCIQENLATLGHLVPRPIGTALLGGHLVTNTHRTERVEHLVKERTKELQGVNERLKDEIVMRTRAEEESREAHEKLETRVKNVRQSF